MSLPTTRHRHGINHVSFTNRDGFEGSRICRDAYFTGVVNFSGADTVIGAHGDIISVQKSGTLQITGVLPAAAYSNLTGWTATGTGLATSTNFNTTTGEYTCPAAGDYRVVFLVHWQRGAQNGFAAGVPAQNTSNVGQRLIGVHVNGALVGSKAAQANSNTTFSTSSLLEVTLVGLSQSDVIRPVVKSTDTTLAGPTQDIIGTPDTTLETIFTVQQL